MTPRPHALDELVTHLRLARFAHGLVCPRCGSASTVGWGSFAARRRRRCGACQRTFSDLTGTPVAYLKKLELLRGYTECLGRGLSIRQAARSIGVAPSTAFRWRHRLLRGLAHGHAEALSGRIELGRALYQESLKGQRKLPRPARRRGMDKAIIWTNQVSVVVAYDRGSNAVSALILHGRPSGADLDSALRSHLPDSPILLAEEGSYGAAAVLARRTGGSFNDARQPAEGHRLDRVDAARAYLARLGQWMRRFRGVATKYLANYLVWHRSLDFVERQRLQARIMRWPLRLPP